VQRLLDLVGDTVPVIVNNGRLDLVAANSLGRALFSPVYGTPGPIRGPANHARFTFLDDRAREFWIDWERDEFHMVYRLIAQKLIPKNCPPARLPEIFIKYCRSVWLSENDSLHKVLYLAWAMLTLLGPRSLAEWAFKMRTSPSIRPSILRGIMRAGRPHN